MSFKRALFDEFADNSGHAAENAVVKEQLAADRHFQFVERCQRVHVRQHIVNKGIIVAASPQKFLKIQREHLVIGLVADTVALNLAVVNAEHGTAANDVEPAVDLEEFERGRNVGKLLQFIEENQGFALNKPLRRIDTRDIFDDIRRFVAVRVIILYFGSSTKLIVITLV